MAMNEIFNRYVYRLHRDRSKKSPLHDYVSQDIIERLSLHLFPDNARVLNIASRNVDINSALPGIDVINADFSERIIASFSGKSKVVLDEEKIPFASDSFDFIIGNLNMHWLNDLPGSLVQMNKILKPKGGLLFSIFGGESLKELRASFLEVEQKEGRVFYRFAPMIKAEALMSVMSRASFDGVIIDSYVMRLEFNDFISMLQAISLMGESNCCKDKIGYLSRNVVDKVEEDYKKHGFDDEKRVFFCNFDIINVVGYKK